MVCVRNPYRLRLETPEGHPNQLFSFLAPGSEQDDTRLAVLVAWHDRAAKAALEPVFHALTRDYVDLRTPSGARLEDFVRALDAAATALDPEQIRGFDCAIVLCRGRGLYLLYSAAMTPQFSIGGPAQPLQSTLRVRVKSLPLHGEEGSLSRSAARLELVRVFFEDEDRVVVWLDHPTAGSALPEAAGAAETARIVLHKEPSVEVETVEAPASSWPEAPETAGKDRVRMSYVAIALVAVVFVTALFGMSRWRAMGTDEHANADAFFGESVDSSLETRQPDRVSADVAEDPERREEDKPDTQLASGEPTEESLQLLWKKNYRDWITSSPRLAQGNVVYGCRDGSLYAVRQSGEPLWDYDSGAGIGATPEVDGTRLYCGNYAGRAFALRCLDGAELWAHDLGARIVASPALGKGLVFYQTYAGDVVALEQKSGHLVWKQHIGGQLRARAIAVGKQVLVTTGDGTLLALEQKTGKTTWSIALGSRVISNPAQVDDLVVLAGQDGQVHALKAKNGELAWRVDLGGALESGVACDDDRLYIGSVDRYVYALSREDGSVAWRFKTGGAIRSTPWVEDGKVYVTSYDRHTYAFDGESGTVLAKQASRAPIYSSPLVHDGKVYFGSNDGTFYCLSALR